MRLAALPEIMAWLKQSPAWLFIGTARMSTSASTERQRSVGLSSVPAWLWIGAGVLLLLLVQGRALLNDSDMFWQIRTGQWIMANAAMPHADVYSFTRQGAPWMSSSWLAQVLFAQAYAAGDWGGVVALTALALSATFALLTFLLMRQMSAVQASLVALLAAALTAQHMLARPHTLALPVMVAWTAGLLAASGRGKAPSWWLLLLMVLWANLHGGFIFGLALIAPMLLDAVSNAKPPERRGLALQWIMFGCAALIAACVTPYGWGSLLAARNIMQLGPLLLLISEWAPPDFSRFDLLEAVILCGIGAALWRGVTLPLPRLLLVLGFLHLMLGHVRNIEIFALLTPLAVAAPLAKQFGWHAASSSEPPMRGWSVAALAAFVAVVGIGGAMVAIRYQPPAEAMPAAAVETLKSHRAARVFNDYSFGGYLIWAGLPPFIDGRAELYGESFVAAAFNAQSLRRPDQLLSLLDTYRIDSTLLVASSPVARLMDHLGGWRKIHGDAVAVVHVRENAGSGVAIKPAPGS